jgi:hypothetical protein
MVHITAEFWSDPDDEDYEPPRIRTWAPYVDDDGDVEQPTLDIYFRSSESLHGAKVGHLALDEAERLARQILDAVVDARMGRFTDSLGPEPD